MLKVTEHTALGRDDLIGWPWSEARLEALPSSLLGSVLVQVYRQTELLGWAAFRWVDLESRGLELDWIWVRDEFRGRKLASQILSAAVAELKPRCLWLEVSDRNKPAIALYSRLGFHVVGQRSAYYPDGSNALLMELTGDPALRSA